MTNLHHAGEQPDPSEHAITRHAAITISSKHPQLVINYFIEEQLPEISVSLADEIAVYTAEVVLEKFKENIAMEDYELKFYEFLCVTFDAETISKLEELLVHPEKDRTTTNLVTVLLLGNKALLDIIDEIFDQAIDDTVDYFAKE